MNCIIFASATHVVTTNHRETDRRRNVVSFRYHPSGGLRHTRGVPVRNERDGSTSHTLADRTHLAVLGAHTNGGLTHAHWSAGRGRGTDAHIGAFLELSTHSIYSHVKNFLSADARVRIIVIITTICKVYKKIKSCQR